MKTWFTHFNKISVTGKLCPSTKHQCLSLTFSQKRITQSSFRNWVCSVAMKMIAMTTLLELGFVKLKILFKTYDWGQIMRQWVLGHRHDGPPSVLYLFFVSLVASVCDWLCHFLVVLCLFVIVWLTPKQEIETFFFSKNIFTLLITTLLIVDLFVYLFIADTK